MLSQRKNEINERNGFPLWDLSRRPLRNKYGINPFSRCFLGSEPYFRRSALFSFLFLNSKVCLTVLPQHIKGGVYFTSAGVFSQNILRYCGLVDTALSCSPEFRQDNVSDTISAVIGKRPSRRV